MNQNFLKIELYYEKIIKLKFFIMHALYIQFFSLISTSLLSQYSTYYNAYITSNVNHNITGNIYSHKTITTIDYGALQLANAQKEKNWLEIQKYENERQKQVALEVAEDPVKAYDYGNLFTISSKFKKNWSKELLAEIRKKIGFKEFKFEYVVPIRYIFEQVNTDRLQNISRDGVKTNVNIKLPGYNIENEIFDFEKNYNEIVIGKEIEKTNENGKLEIIFNHKKDLNRAEVYGKKGYRTTIIWEDKFEYHITDEYRYIDETIGNGVMYLTIVMYSGDKDEIDFEKLEGRRVYLKPLIEKIIANARVNDLEILKE